MRTQKPDVASIAWKVHRVWGWSLGHALLACSSGRSSLGTTAFRREQPKGLEVWKKAVMVMGNDPKEIDLPVRSLTF